MSDARSLADFTRTRSSDAFADLVRRYVDLVYSTARRMVGDTHLAQDVTQAAFLVLAKKADRIDPRHLPGWLVNTTRLVAKEAIRSNVRRSKYETRAVQMRTETQTTTGEPAAEELLPLLDDALSQLNDADRSAVVLRFLEGLSFADVGTAMGFTEEAARKRVGRAVEKLRAIFMRKGVIPSVGGLMVVLATQQAPAVPVPVIDSITVSASAGGTTTSAMLAKAVISTMTWAKIKLIVVVAMAVIFTGGVGLEVIRRATAQPISNVPTSQSVAFVGHLKNNVSIELFAVAAFPAQPDKWWRPNGTPMLGHPNGSETFAGIAGTIRRGIGGTHPLRNRLVPNGEVEFRFRVSGPSPAISSRDVRFFESLDQGPSSGAIPMQPEDPVAGIYGVWLWPTVDGPRSYRVGVAGGSWHPELSNENPSAELAGTLTVNGINTPVTISAVAERDGKAVVELLGVPEVRPDPFQSRLVVLTTSSQTLTPSRLDRINAPRGDGTAFTFDCPARLVSQVRYETRPYDWVEFRNVSLEHGVNTDVQIVTSDAKQFKATLSDGTTSELVAIGEEATGQWWRPDGSPTVPPYPRRNHVKEDIFNPKPDVRYLYLVSTTARRDGSSIAHTSAASEEFSQSAVIGTEHQRVNYRTDLVEIAPDRNVLSHRMRMASQPSSIVVKLTADNLQLGELKTSDEKPLGTEGVCRIEMFREVNGKVQFDAYWPKSVGVIGSVYSIEPVLTDTDGKAVMYSSYTNGTEKSDTNHLVTFDVPMSRVAEVGLRVTHWDQWAEFRNVSLKPGVKTDVEVVTSDVSKLVSVEDVVKQLVESLAAGNPANATSVYMTRNEFAQVFQGPDLDQAVQQMADRRAKEIEQLLPQLKGAKFVRLTRQVDEGIVTIPLGKRIGPWTATVPIRVMDNVHVIIDLGGKERDLKVDEMMEVNGQWRLFVKPPQLMPTRP